MEYKWLENIDQFNDIAGEWDNALLVSGEDNPFLLSAFITTWWKYFGAGLNLRIFVLYEDGRIIAGLPLLQTRSGYMEYLGRDSACYTEILTVNKDSHFFWGVFLDALMEIDGWRYLCLKRYRKNRIYLDQQCSVEIADRRNILFDINHNGLTYLVNIPRDFDDYIKSLPSTLRRYVRYAEREFSKIGKITLLHLDNADALDAWIDNFTGLSRAAFRARDKQSVYEDENRCLFLKELLRNFYQRGYLHAHALKSGDKIVAMHFGYSLGNNLNWVFPSFDAKYRKFHPGHLLIYKLIEYSSKENKRMIDLYTGERLYKKQWGTIREDMVIVEIRRRSLRGMAERFVALRVRNAPIIERLRLRLRRVPFLLRSVRRMKEIRNRYFY